MPMKNKVWIGNGTVVLENRECNNGSVLFENGKILEINKPCPIDAQKVDAHNGYILPGFVDIHLHGGGDFDFMDGSPEDFIKVAKAHCEHGTTAMCPTTMTCDDELLEHIIQSYKAALKLPNNGAHFLGLHLEGPFFSSGGKGAQPVSEQRIPTREFLEHIIRIGEGNIIRWDESPELPETKLFGDVMKENGIMASIAHTMATAEEANSAFEWGFSHITHFFCITSSGQKINGICHSGVNEATLINDNITVELIGDGRHIPKEHMLLAYRIKGADNMALITDAMRAAGTNDTESVLGARNTGVPVVIKDGVAQLTDLSFYAGSVATMDRVLRVAHMEYGIPLTDTVKMMSLTPARLAFCDNCKGSISVGKDADIVIMNENFYVEKVFVNGVLQVNNI